MLFNFDKSTTIVVVGLLGFIGCVHATATTALPTTEDRMGTDYCAALKASNASEFQAKCESDSGFRIYFCGVTCDSLYSTTTELAASKTLALSANCDDMFTPYYCNNMVNQAKCAGNTQYTAFRLCTKTCGYC